MAAGAAAIGGLTYAAKKSIDFQDAFAGVRKTVEGSKADLDLLQTQLRGLATRIPVDFTDLAAIGQEAGALGVASRDVAKFTEVVSRLSAATVGLTPEAAAEAFGKLGNVLRLSGDDYERLGSALVELGNNAASSEGDIIEVAKRFGAAGSQAHLSAAQILGMSSAIASLGVEPEAAGSALSRVFNKINTYIGTGDEKLKSLAKVSGETVAAFSKGWATDASGAFEHFLASLSKMDRFDAAKALKQAGITNVRDTNMIYLLAQNYGELHRQIGLSTDAYEKNTALQSVSATRFDTLAGKLHTFKNLITDSAAAMGDRFTPALGRAVDKLRIFVEAHRDDLLRIGDNIGEAIDKIDWNRVADAARGVADAAGLILAVIAKIPPEIDLAVAGFLALNKVTGGAATSIVAGAVDVAGGAAGMALRALGTRGGGLGRVAGTLGALTAQPVFVTNWPLGGIGGIGGMGVPGAGGATGLLGSALKILPWVGFGALIFEGFLQGNRDHPEFYGSHPDGPGSSGYPKRGNQSYNGVPIAPPGGGMSLEDRDQARYERDKPRSLGDRDEARDQRDSRGMATAITSVGNAVRAAFPRPVFLEFQAMIAKLHDAKGPKEIAQAVAAAVRLTVDKKQGNVDQTRTLLNGLRAQLHATRDPHTASILRTAIGKVEAKLANREWVHGQLQQATRIANSTHSTTDKIHALQGIMRTLDGHNATAQRAVQRKIDTLKGAAVGAALGTTLAILNKDMKPVVTIGPTVVNTAVSVGIRQFASSSVRARRMGNVWID